MLIKESLIVPPSSSLKLLGKLQYIEESVSPAVIPVTENSRLGKYIVSLEDINEYCDNNYTDPGYVISQICESNGIDSDDIAFSVAEESIILEDEVAENAINLMENDIPVIAKSTPHDELYDILEADCELICQGYIPSKIGQILIQEAWKDLTPTQQKIFNKLKQKKETNPSMITGRDYDKYQILKRKVEDGRENALYRARFVLNNRKSAVQRRAKNDEDFSWYVHDNPDVTVEPNGRYAKDWEVKRYQDYENAKILKNRKIDDQIENSYKQKKDQEEEEDSQNLPLDTEISLGMAELDKMNLKDELDSQRSQYDTKLKFKNKEISDLKKKQEDNIQNIAKQNEAKIKRLEQQAQRSNNRGFIAKVIARLNSIARKYRDKYSKLKVSGPKTAIQKVLGFIAKCVASLTAKLHSLTR